MKGLPPFPTNCQLVAVEEICAREMNAKPHIFVVELCYSERPSHRRQTLVFHNLWVS